MMTDPSDDCTFWYTQEYQATTQSANWNTRIGSFKFSSCGPSVQTTTNTTLGSSANPSSYGQSVMFTATVAATSGTPTGSVTFKNGPTSLGTMTLSGGSASLSTSSLSAGPHSITASYSGDSNFLSSASNVLSQLVNQAASATSVSSNANPSAAGQNVTFTATVSPSAATGTAQFFDGATSLGTVPLTGGKATLSTSALSVGPHSITAQYSGDTNYTGSTSSVLTQTVNSLISTTTSLTSSLNPSVRGQQVTFTATVKPSSGAGTPTGTVTFLDGGTTLGSSALNASGVATFSTASLSVGTHSITARYGGDTNYNGSTSAVLSQTVKRKK
jgi:hypothetical protein